MIRALSDNKAIQYQCIDHWVMSGPLFTYAQCTHRLIIRTPSRLIRAPSSPCSMAGRRARHGYSRMLPERAVKDYRSPTQSPENNKIKDLQAMTG